MKALALLAPLALLAQGCATPTPSYYYLADGDKWQGTVTMACDFAENSFFGYDKTCEGVVLDVFDHAEADLACENWGYVGAIPFSSKRIVRYPDGTGRHEIKFQCVED